MQQVKQFFKKRREAKMKKKETEAKKVVLDELFNDIYHNRARIYKVNFVRGIVFGAGSALGGTVVIALIVWILSLFVNLPVIGNLFENAQHSLQQTTSETTQ